MKHSVGRLIYSCGLGFFLLCWSNFVEARPVCDYTGTCDYEGFGGNAGPFDALLFAILAVIGAYFLFTNAGVRKAAFVYIGGLLLVGFLAVEAKSAFGLGGAFAVCAVAWFIADQLLAKKFTPPTTPHQATVDTKRGPSTTKEESIEIAPWPGDETVKTQGTEPYSVTGKKEITNLIPPMVSSVTEPVIRPPEKPSNAASNPSTDENDEMEEMNNHIIDMMERQRIDAEKVRISFHEKKKAEYLSASRIQRIKNRDSRGPSGTTPTISVKARKIFEPEPAEGVSPANHLIDASAPMVHGERWILDMDGSLTNADSKVVIPARYCVRLLGSRPGYRVVNDVYGVRWIDDHCVTRQ